MRIKESKAWITTDGVFHSDVMKAAGHQARIDLSEVVSKFLDPGADQAPLITFLLANAVQIDDILTDYLNLVPQAEPLPGCPRCGGRGLVRVVAASGNSETDECPVCKGTGHARD